MQGRQDHREPDLLGGRREEVRAVAGRPRPRDFPAAAILRRVQRLPPYIHATQIIIKDLAMRDGTTLPAQPRHGTAGARGNVGGGGAAA